MFRAIRTILAVLIVPAALALASVSAQAQTVVKVSLLDNTVAGGAADFGPRGGGFGPGMIGPGMMGPGGGYGTGMMGRGVMGAGMMAIRTSRSSAPAGKIRFVIDNLSRSFPHELLVIAVDNVNAQLPYNEREARVDEDKVKVLGDTGDDLKPDETKTLDVTLPAGSYLLVCNLPGHYAAGMVTAFTVTPAEVPTN